MQKAKGLGTKPSSGICFGLQLQHPDRSLSEPFQRADRIKFFPTLSREPFSVYLGKKTSAAICVSLIFFSGRKLNDSSTGSADGLQSLADSTKDLLDVRSLDAPLPPTPLDAAATLETRLSGSYPIPDSTEADSVWQNARDVAQKCALVGMKIAQGALPVATIVADSFPIAKGVVSAVAAVLEIAQRVMDNKEGILEAISRLSRLVQIIADAGGGIREQWKSHGLRLMDVLESLVKMRDQNIITGTLSSRDDETRIQEYVQKIVEIMQDFQLQVVLSVSNNVDHLIDADVSRELERLRYSSDAEYKKGKLDRKRASCLQGTRENVLKDLDKWLTDQDDFRVFWLNGMAGTGKSTIVDSFTDRTATRNTAVVASFFASRDYETARDIDRIIPSLAYQLAFKLPTYRAVLASVLRNELSPENLPLEEQLVKLVLDPLKTISGSTPPILLAIDALDECDHLRIHSLPFIELLLCHIAEFRNVHVKVFLSSRPAQEISSEFRRDSLLRNHEQFLLHEVHPDDIRHDISIFVDSKMRDIRLRNPRFNFGQEDVKLVTDTAIPLFIFAATICAFISGSDTRARRDPQRQLQLVRSFLGPGSGSSNAEQATKALDLLYQKIFVDAFMAEDGVHYDDPERAKNAIFLVASVILISQPLNASTLAILLGDPYDSDLISELLQDLHSTITEPTDAAHPIRIIHASFQDHLTTESRAHKQFYVDPSLHHAALAVRCFEVMVTTLLHGNLLGLNMDEEYDATQLSSRTLDFSLQKVLPTLQYACQYWSHHLCECPFTPNSLLLNALERFTSTYLLRWIEVLVIFGQLDRAVPMITSSRRWLSKVSPVDSVSNAASLLSDLERMVYEFHETMDTSPIQVYVSAFPFLPRQCTLFLQYRDTIEPVLRVLDVLTGANETWNATLRTVSAPDDLDHIEAICVSPHSQTLACYGFVSDSNDNDKESLLFWDIAVGGRMNVLQDELLSAESGDNETQAVRLVFHSDHCLLGISNRTPPIVWSVDMDQQRLQKMPLDLARAEEILRGNDNFDDMFTHFSECLSFSSDGSRLASLAQGRDQTMYLLTWMLKDNQEEAETPGAGGTDLAFVFDKCLELNGFPSDEVASERFWYKLELQWSPDMLTISICWAKRHAYLCTLPDNDCTSSLSPVIFESSHRICGIVWASGGGYLACHSDSLLSVYSVSEVAAGPREATEVWKKEIDYISCVAFSPDAQFLAVAEEAGSGFIDMYAVQDSASVSTWPGGYIEDLVYTPDGNRLIGRKVVDVVVLDANTCAKSQSSDHSPHEQLPRDFVDDHPQCSPDGTTIAAAYVSNDLCWVGVWDAARGHQIASIQLEDVDVDEDPEPRLMYTYDGRELLVIATELVSWYDLDACRGADVPLDIQPRLTLRPLADMEFLEHGIALSPQSHFVFLLQYPSDNSEDGSESDDTGNSSDTGNGDDVESSSDSDDSDSSSDIGEAVSRAGSIYDTRSGDLIWKHQTIATGYLLGLWTEDSEVVWSANGDMIACQSRDSIKLWPFHELPGPDDHPQSIPFDFGDVRETSTSLSFSPSGEHLLVCHRADSGDILCSWDVQSGAVLRKIERDASSFLRVYIPPSGGMLVRTPGGLFIAEDLLSTGENGSSPSPYDGPYDRYHVERDEQDRWVTDSRGRKVFALPKSHAVSSDRVVIMRIRTESM
ncbi:hypothetical protein EIP91_011012 [Steccherinum ochraceum]|uniref:Nephrocystin 3-like N-terminal domain-containing protein n=1 Tax=Steccherinum ochraceum TaxID=92696 RepID=A0A4R0RBT6_9APHY|nr:hypothetical protein EIP91_011012 [Steccherinum ochraceum]